MLMFLTRLGHDSKMIVTGDATQVDLPDGTRSGLADAMDKLRGIKGIARVELGQADIVRHRLVQNIVNAYEKHPDGVGPPPAPDRNRPRPTARDQVNGPST